MNYEKTSTITYKQIRTQPSGCFGKHNFKMIIYYGKRAYRCEQCTWTLQLRW